MIDEMFQEGTDKVLRDMAEQPAPGAPAQISRPGTFTGAWRGLGGVAAGGLEAAASGLETAGGFGQVTAAAGAYSAGGMGVTPNAAESKQNDAARAKLMREGVDMTDADADKLRASAKDMMPDPLTTGAAGQVIGGLTRFGAKAVGYVGGLGPAGALPLGFDEALTESDKQRLQGVDYGTRSLAGAVAGVTAGASMLIPMTGATAAVRGLKGIAVGEGSMVGQQEAEKLILEHQHYDKLADQYDPFDPVSLAVGLIPGAIGAKFGHAVPKAVAPKPLLSTVESLETGGEANPDAAVSPKGALGRMQVMPETADKPGFGVEPAAKNADGTYKPGELDRVGTQLLSAWREHYGSDAKALAAYNAGPGALDAAMAHGDDWLAHLPDETQNYVRKGTGMLSVTAAAEDPHVVAAARTLQTADALDASRLTPDDDMPGRDLHQQTVEEATQQMERGEPVRVSEDAAANIDRFTPEAVEKVSALARVVEQMRTEQEAGDGPIRPNHAAFDEARAAQENGTENPAPRETPARPGEPENPVAAHLDAMTARMDPDMMVRVEGRDEPMRLGDHLDALREEAAATGRDSKLLEVAAQCATSS